MMPSSSFQKWVGMEGKGFVQTSSPLSSYTCLPAGEVVGKRRGGREEGAGRERRGEKMEGKKGRKDGGGREMVEKERGKRRRL